MFIPNSRLATSLRHLTVPLYVLELGLAERLADGLTTVSDNSRWCIRGHSGRKLVVVGGWSPTSLAIVAFSDFAKQGAADTVADST